MKSEKGFSLVEVLIAFSLLMIISLGMISAFSTNFSLLHRGKSITYDTFEAQETMENLIINSAENEALETISYTLFSSLDQRTVTGKKIEHTIQGGRVLFAAVSDIQIETPPLPRINDVIISAYPDSGSTTRTFPWTGSELRVEYDDSDELIFDEIHRWYKSGDDSSHADDILINPDFPAEYDILKEEWDIDSVGKLLSGTETADKGRYIIYGATPYSSIGKLGREARNEIQILIMDPPANSYWGNFIETVFLDQYDGYNDLLVRADYNDIYTYTTLNQERLTLNVETLATSKRTGSFIYADIPSTYNLDFSVTVEVEVDEKSYIESSDLGYGIFIGEANLAGQDSGYMLEFDAKNNQILLQKMLNGGYETGFTTLTEALDPEFDWNALYKVKISILKSKGQFRVQFYGGDANPDVDVSIEDVTFTGVDISKGNDYIGFKTWSDIAHIDETVEILVGQKNLTAHFYDINFDEIELPASGGEIFFEVIDGTYYIFHVFKSNDVFEVKENIEVDVLIVAGGGGGGGGGYNAPGGGGGAGGLIFKEGESVLSGDNINIVVGAGGSGGDGGSNGSNGANGENSLFGTLETIGGGGGSCFRDTDPTGSGGSGGGGSAYIGGSSFHGNQEEVAKGGFGTAGTPPQGYNGGDGTDTNNSGGGGGYGSAGGDGTVSQSGNGGAGFDGSSFFGPNLLMDDDEVKIGDNGWFAGGGGGASRNDVNLGEGGNGGSGNGAYGDNRGSNALDNTGGGGGGSGYSQNGGNGGSGIVIVRYAY